MPWSAEPGAGGVVLVPYFEGERTPNLPHAKASFHGLSIASSTRSNLARAAIEGMLCGLSGGLDALRAQGSPATRLLLIGGAVQNPAVQAIAAQVFDLPVVVPSPGEYVARGAAVQAAWASQRQPAGLAGRGGRRTRPGLPPGHQAELPEGEQSR